MLGCGTTLARSLAGGSCPLAEMTGVVRAAAPVSVTPFRKSRRLTTDRSRNFLRIWSSLAVTDSLSQLAPSALRLADPVRADVKRIEYVTCCDDPADVSCD